MGTTAKRQAVTNPDNTVYSVKRFMGRRFNDETVQRDIGLVPFKVTQHANGDAYVTMGNKEYAPPEVSAMILQEAEARRRGQTG